MNFFQQRLLLTATSVRSLLILFFGIVAVSGSFLSGCKPTTEPQEQAPVFSLRGSIEGDVASLPPDTRVVLVWANPGGIPRDYSYVAGIGSIDRAAKTYQLNLPRIPHDSAFIMMPIFDPERPQERVLLRRDSSWKIGIGFIVMLNDGTLKEGLLDSRYPLPERFVGGVNNTAVVYRFGNLPTSTNPRDGLIFWGQKFSTGLSVGKGVKSNPPPGMFAFDTFEPVSGAQANEQTMTVTNFSGFKVPNWTR